MMRSLWSAATGMKTQQFNVDVISNNLANVNTTGYKKSRADFVDLDEHGDYDKHGMISSLVEAGDHDLPLLKIGNRLVSARNMSLEQIKMIVDSCLARSSSGAEFPHTWRRAPARCQYPNVGATKRFTRPLTVAAIVVLTILAALFVKSKINDKDNQ